MRALLLIIACALLPLAAHAQDQTTEPRAVPLDRLEDFGVTVEGLDAVHGPALHADTSLAVFADRPDDVKAAWRSLLGKLANHLHAEGFTWSEPLRGYHRFYFAPDGRVNRVLYHVRDLDEARTEEYGRLLETFAQTARFDLAADVPYSQCSPLVLAPPAE